MKPASLRPRAVRTIVLFAAMSLVLLLYMGRLVQLQVFQYEDWARRSARNHQSKRVLEMKRGTITDRNGLELALSVETYSVYLFTREVKNLNETANLLATVLPMTRDQILQKIGNRKGYLPIIQKLDRNLAQKVMALNLPGVNLEENYRRFYPQNSLAANLIGFCGADGHGLEGLELSFDKTLRGYAGLAVQEDVSFGEDGPARMRIVQPPMGGSNMVLTIDSFIQHILETELANLVNKFKPIDATAIAMDPMTGEILGMACLPTYDLNQFASSTPDSHRNRPITDIYEPGSCMKIFPTAVALQTGRIRSDTRFYCKGYGELPNRRVKCHGQHGLVDIDKGIAESCNATMVQISQMIDGQDLYRMYKNLGFGEPTGLEVPGESAGILYPPSRWSGFSAASLCIGQEIAVTGLQLVRAYSAIANGGWLMQPRIVKKLYSPNHDIQEEFGPQPIRRVFGPNVAHRLRKMLASVVENGTGRLAALPEYTVGGKTSTAQKPNPRGGYFWEKVITSFIGIAPIQEPRIVLYVAVNEPKGDEKTLYGGKVAAPAFAAILDRILKHLKVPPDKTPPPALATATPQIAQASTAREISFLSLMSAPVLPVAEAAEPPPGPPAIVTAPQPASPASGPASGSADTLPGVVPDVRGMPLREAARRLAGLHLPVAYEGDGLAVAQTPPPGTPLAQCSQIVVRFSPQPTGP
ncbi:MAG: Cell division protein FtsI [Peptidoglycan synthetase] [Candidatus Ozemobacter sibiricus]|uniref:Cell division protein FtsI [Peptidoglycan synthetase] n=1 Tax=Candidatus Ozemobacter sibiricus TaxID=2268124 RepID=A0A367ZTF9_9BACT|nr:MAG: Cell division protein FtsI [Peptidoglycan synthetase] [Candidatus Ozemobacter sibiricus]